MEELRSRVAQASQQAAAEEHKARGLVAVRKQLELQVEEEQKRLSEVRMAKHRPELEVKAKLKEEVDKVRDF